MAENAAAFFVVLSSCDGSGRGGSGWRTTSMGADLDGGNGSGVYTGAADLDGGRFGLPKAYRRHIWPADLTTRDGATDYGHTSIKETGPARIWQPGSVPAGLMSDLTRESSGAALVPRGVYAGHSHPSIKGKRPADLETSPGNRRRERAFFTSPNQSKKRARDSGKRANK